MFALAILRKMVELEEQADYLACDIKLYNSTFAEFVADSALDLGLLKFDDCDRLYLDEQI